MSAGRTKRRAASHAAFTFTGPRCQTRLERRRNLRKRRLPAGALASIGSGVTTYAERREIGSMTEFDLTNQLGAKTTLEDSTLAARGAAWRRFIDTVWAGDGCAHAELDLFGQCRRCGERVEGERGQ